MWACRGQLTLPHLLPSIESGVRYGAVPRVFIPRHRMIQTIGRNGVCLSMSQRYGDLVLSF
jgi:hypothetical protein